MANTKSDIALLAQNLRPFIKKEIEREDKKKKERLSTKGVVALAKPPTNPDHSVNKMTPFGVTFDQLRSFSTSYPIVRACINHRISAITQLAWTVSPIKVVMAKDEKESIRERCEVIRKKLKFPAGHRQLTFRGFLTKIVEDVLTIDAVAIERRKTVGGDVVAWQPFDAATIELLLMPDGSTPLPPLPAYQQKIQGKITAELTTDDIYYGMMHPRTSNPYGLSPLETLVVTVTTALKLQSYNLAYLTEGNVPEGFVELPKDIASNPEQLAAWQEAWDAIFSGDPRYQRKLKFLPEGMKYIETKKQSDMGFERFEKWLLLNTCACYQVSPQDIGFTTDVNKAVADTQWEIGKERGMMPLAHFVKEIMDEIVQEDLNQQDLEFGWLNLNPTNALEEAKSADILIRIGAVSVDEFRIGEGMDPIGMSNYIMTPIGPIFTHDLIEQSAAGFEPTLPYAPPVSGTTTAPGDKGENSPTASRKDTTNPETLRAQARPKPKAPEKDKKQADKSMIIEDLKKWKKAAKNDLKLSQSYRDFYSSIIDTRTKSLVKYGLNKAKTKEEIDEVFDPLLEQVNEYQDLRELYGKISNIISG